LANPASIFRIHRGLSIDCYHGPVLTKEVAMARRRGVCCELPLPAAGEWAEQRATVLKALADPTRLSMVAALKQMDGPVCICDFTAAYDLSQPTISHHMGKLRAAGLVEASKQGIWTYYRLHADLPGPVSRLLDAALTAV
jgi:ArsR family transcriptional regulator